MTLEHDHNDAKPLGDRCGEFLPIHQEVAIARECDDRSITIRNLCSDCGR